MGCNISSVPFSTTKFLLLSLVQIDNKQTIKVQVVTVNKFNVYTSTVAASLALCRGVAPL